MPWFFSIPEFLKKRACRYLLQHYMGQFLAEKISLEDLTVDLYSGTGTITNVDINVEAINEVLVGTSAPVRVVSGYIGHVTVSVPWTALLKDSCKVEISGLALSIVPYIAPSTATDEPVSMTDSLFFSMTTSLQLAEEVLKSGPSPGEASAESSPGFEGMEALARAIELVLARVQITLKDTVVQVNYETADHTLEYFLKLRVKSIQFYDELSQQESSVDGEMEDPPQPVSMVTKVLQLSGLSVEFDYSHLTDINLREEQDSFRVSDTLSPPAFGADVGGRTPVLRQSSSDSVGSESDSQGVPIAQASGEISVRVKLRQSDTVQGPKLEVEGHLAALHILLSPQQLQMLVEMATGITSQGSTPGFSRIPPGQNRPIPKGDMRTIESQLRHHVREERQRKQRREDLLHADPWESSLRQGTRGGMLESSYSSTAEEFFSLELGNSMAEVGLARGDGGTNLDDLFAPLHAESTSKTSSSGHAHGRHFTSNNLDNIPLHEGQGLQQLSQSPGQVFRKAGGGGRGLSPPTQRSRSGTASSASGSSYSSTQSTTSRQIHVELQHDLCRYMFTVSGVTIALLEADPPHIHMTPGLPKKPADSLGGSAGGIGYGQCSSLDEGGLDPMRYFENMAELLKNGVNRRVLQDVQEKLAQILPTDHLFLWLSTVRTGVSSEGSVMDLDLSVASAELWEYLYRNEANLPHITSPISVSPIIQLVEDSAQSKPCVKLKFSMCMEASKKRSSSDQQTSIDLSLTTAHVNLDVTLLDRAQPLLRTPLRSRQSSMRSNSMEKMKHSLYMTTSNYHTVNLQRQAVFNQAVAVESAGKRDHKTSIRVDCSSLDVSLRFPIPDLQKDKRPPWYHSSLRPEVLYVVLADVGLSTLFHSGGVQHRTSFDAHFNTTKAYLSCDGSSESRELFMTVGARNVQQGDGFSTARIKVEVQPIPDSVLEQPGKSHRGGGVGGKGNGSGYSSLEEMALLKKDSKPSPFSGRMDMVSTGKVVEDSSSEENVVVHSEELHVVLPGSPEEMAEFEQHASSMAQYSVHCSLPSVTVHLPSKAFLETLYNRFGSDLVLWKPATPAVAERTNARSMLLSCMDVIQPAITKEERFQMCKSVLKEEESDEEGCEEAGLLSTVVEAQQPGPSGLSLLALTVAIDRGRMSMLTTVEPTAGLDPGGVPQRQEQEGERKDSPPTSSLYESATFEPEERLLDLSPRMSHPEGGGGGSTGEHGLVVVEFSDARMFITSGYLGDATHDYLSGQIKELSVSHLGSLEADGYPLYSSVDDAADHTLPSKLPSVVNKSEEGARLRPGSHDQPMFAIAMEIKLDAERNTKTNKCAVALHNTTMRYHMSAAEHSCFKQLGDFFSLTEEPVPGYEPPSFITELHAHTFGCALEYRPLHLPLRALLTVDSVSLSTNVVTGAPLLVLRLMVDETLLFLSNKQEESTNLQQDYVCVMELDWFQMTLRLCNNDEGDSDYQKVFSRLPEISMECSSNTVHLRTCVDSCLALRDLLVYMATYGDLQAHAPGYPTQTRAYSSLAAESSSSLSSQNSYSSSPPLASLKNEDIGDLISEAMEDTSSLESSTLSSHRQAKSTKRHKHRHSPKKDSKSNLQIHMSTEKSVHMVFNSDSEDEGHPETNSSAPGFGGRQSYGPQSPRGQPSSPKQDSIFSESDDDFCVLDAPTTTKVAPGAKPMVKSLLEEGEELKVIENHFAIPDRRTDQLQRPKSFPEPVMQYTLKEITLVWDLYGGSDFSLPPQSSAASSPGSSPLNVRRLPRDGGYSHSPPLRIRTTSGGGSNGKACPTDKSPVAGRKHQRGSKSSAGGAYVSGDASKLAKGKKVRGSAGDWKAAGGPGRDHTVLMEIELVKVRFQHETYPPDTEQISRVVFLVQDVEIRDRLADSQINKFLYQYTTEARPRQSHAHMVSLKVLFTRPELEANPSIEEAAVRLSLLPIRLNIDQDAVFFLYDFIKKVTDAATLNIPPTSEPIRVSGTPGASEVVAESVRGTSQSFSGGSISDVFIKSFVFQPELPIRIDYEGKRFQMEVVGTLAGILLGLSHLDCSEVTLRSLTYKKGLLGWDKLVEFATNEWIDDIKSSQLPHILKGVGPLHHVTQLFLGMKDLVWLPWEQYQEDGRIVRGLQRGASSFTTSTGVAFVELTSRLLHTVQSMAQMAYDLVTPGNQQSSSQALIHQHKAPHQPLDFREGVANAYDVVTAGIGGTARDLMHTAAQEHEEKGMTGAVGGVLRQLPGTLVKPIILASEATRHMLGGMRNQFVPDARKEANQKWL